MAGCELLYPAEVGTSGVLRIQVAAQLKVDFRQVGTISMQPSIFAIFRLPLCILHVATWIRPTGRRVLGPYRVQTKSDILGLATNLLDAVGNTGSGKEGSAAPEPRPQAPAIYSRPDLRASDLALTVAVFWEPLL
ncbi:hypothetical protein DFH06DRAFT_1130835 [Mycena polygramma]|nr:hypothetical protein DFH06DRAFT_1130835 [Mycena polygramma]